jgi:hypothetical protein
MLEGLIKEIMLSLILVPAAYAQPIDQAGPVDLDAIAQMNGKCVRLKFASTDATKACENKIINETYKSGRVGFTFVAGDLAIVAFSGAGQTQRKLTADKVLQPIDAIFWTLIAQGAKPISVKATGSCTYTNPYKGPSSISCVAHTDQGDFQGNFLSDGQPPEIQHF